MKFTLFLLALVLVAPVAAQSGSPLRVEPTLVEKEIVVDFLDENFEDVTSVLVTNNSNTTLQLLRETVRKQQPQAWNYRSLDRMSRTAPYVMSATEQREGRQIALPPGESAVFYVVLRPDGMTGKGSTELRFTDLTLPGTVLATVSLTTVISQRTMEGEGQAADQRPAPTSVRLYPNPASDRFYVEAPRGTKVGRVEVTNTLGRQIQNYRGALEANGYDISSLPDGLYLISIYDTVGNKLKTLRLLHRQFGA